MFLSVDMNWLIHERFHKVWKKMLLIKISADFIDRTQGCDQWLARVQEAGNGEASRAGERKTSSGQKTFNDMSISCKPFYFSHLTFTHTSYIVFFPISYTDFKNKSKGNIENGFKRLAWWRDAFSRNKKSEMNLLL